MAEVARAGFEAASVNQIARDAGVAKGVIYYYFVDREALCRAAVDEVRSLLVGPTDVAALPRTPARYWRHLEASYRRATAGLAADPVAAGVFRRVLGAARGPEAPAAAEAIVADLRGFVAGALRLGRRIGAVRRDVPEDLLAAAMLGLGLAADGWLLDAVGEGVSAGEAAGEVLRLVRSVLAPPPGPPRPGTPAPRQTPRQGRRRGARA